MWLHTLLLIHKETLSGCRARSGTLLARDSARTLADAGVVGTEAPSAASNDGSEERCGDGSTGAHGVAGVGGGASREPSMDLSSSGTAQSVRTERSAHGGRGARRGTAAAAGARATRRRGRGGGVAFRRAARARVPDHHLHDGRGAAGRARGLVYLQPARSSQVGAAAPGV